MNVCGVNERSERQKTKKNVLSLSGTQAFYFIDRPPRPNIMRASVPSEWPKTYTVFPRIISIFQFNNFLNMKPLRPMLTHFRHLLFQLQACCGQLFFFLNLLIDENFKQLSQYLQIHLHKTFFLRQLFEGGNYSRKYGTLVPMSKEFLFKYCPSKGHNPLIQSIFSGQRPL